MATAAMAAVGNSAEAVLNQFASQVYSLVQKVNTLKSAMSKLGTWQDTVELRSSLTTRTAALGASFAEASATCREASAQVHAPSARDSKYHQGNLNSLSKLEQDLLAASEQHRQLGTQLVAKLKASEPRRKPTETPLIDLQEPGGDSPSQSQQQEQLSRQAHDLSLEIADRDRGIAEVLSSVLEVQQEMTDIAELVDHQDPLVQRVAVNIQDVDHRIEAGFNQVRIANARNKKNLSWWNCLVIIVGVVVGLIISFSLL